ncbi:hypothetical protein D9M68_997520 [compost metagenome]
MLLALECGLAFAEFLDHLQGAAVAVFGQGHGGSQAEESDQEQFACVHEVRLVLIQSKFCNYA